VRNEGCKEEYDFTFIPVKMLTPTTSRLFHFATLTGSGLLVVSALNRGGMKITLARVTGTAIMATNQNTQ
jgi:hypothetical protein